MFFNLKQHELQTKPEFVNTELGIPIFEYLKGDVVNFALELVLLNLGIESNFNLSL